MEWSCSLWEIPAHRSRGTKMIHDAFSLRLLRRYKWGSGKNAQLPYGFVFLKRKNILTMIAIWWLFQWTFLLEETLYSPHILEPWNELLSRLNVCMSVTFLRLYSPVWLYIFVQLLAVFWRQTRGAGIGSQISPSLSNLAVTLVERSWSECFAEILRQKLNNYHDGLILWVKTWKIACSSRGAIASRPRGTEENFPLWKACQA
jgi:hypothetical protein